MDSGAHEAFATGTVGGLPPVRETDGRIVGDGAAGPVTLRLRDLYRAPIGRECPPPMLA